jgi:hypothetical protein
VSPCASDKIIMLHLQGKYCADIDYFPAAVRVVYRDEITGKGYSRPGNLQGRITNQPEQRIRAIASGDRHSVTLPKSRSVVLSVCRSRQYDYRWDRKL